MIVGASGAGKSSLALQLISLGATLISDDRTVLSRSGTALRASAPSAIAGMIEARGVGLLRVRHVDDIPIALIVDLDRTETTRLPSRHLYDLSGFTFPCLLNAPSPHFAAAILLYLKDSIGLGA
ncbi:MAG: HPr kinase/phosphorylase [Sulfitobacter sp.]